MRCTECNGTIKPVVGIDIDGTIGQYHRHFFNFATEYLGIQPEAARKLHEYDGSKDIATFMGLSKREYRQVKLAYRQGGMKRSMPVFAGAREMIQAIKDLGVEIWITTTRPYLQVGNVDEDTREWLHRNRIPFDYLIYDDDKYFRLVQMTDSERLVCVLEDQPDDWRRAIELGIHPLIRRTKWNEGCHFEESIGFSVYSLIEAEDVIKMLVVDWKADHAA